MDLDLSLGSAGVVLSDIAPRLYFGADCERVSIGAEVQLDPVTGDSVNYVLSGLPDNDHDHYQITYEFPEGVWSRESWGGSLLSPPESIIIPIRDSGLVAEDLGLTLLHNGVIASDTLSVVELGTVSEPGDYRVSGWSITTPGRWMLRWSYGGLYWTEKWTVPASIDEPVHFLSILPMQPPSDVLGLDESNRTQFSFNIQAYSTSLPDLAGCIASRLVSNSLGVLNSSIFIGPLSVVPSDSGDDGPYIAIRSTGGGPPSLRHSTSSSTSITTHFSTCQVVVIASSYSVAQTRAAEVYSACVSFNVDIAPI